MMRTIVHYIAFLILATLAIFAVVSARQAPSEKCNHEWEAGTVSSQLPPGPQEEFLINKK